MILDEASYCWPVRHIYGPLYSRCVVFTNVFVSSCLVRLLCPVLCVIYILSDIPGLPEITVFLDKMSSCMLVCSHECMRSAALAERHTPPRTRLQSSRNAVLSTARQLGHLIGLAKTRPGPLALNVTRPGLKRGLAAHTVLRNKNATSHATSLGSTVSSSRLHRMVKNVN